VSGFKIQYTVSVGVESLTDKGISLSVLMNNADKALYKAKENGRNRVEIFGR
jgi:diguanylate cyclase (GGDEF)-like protein